MAITVLEKSAPRPVNGGNSEGLFEQWFKCKWTSQDVSGTVPSGLRYPKRIKDVVLYQEPEAGEGVYFAGTIDSTTGKITLGSGDTISLGRIYSLTPTSGLIFSFAIEGHR